MVDGLMRGLFIAGILILAAVTAEAQAPEAGLSTDAFLAACIADPVVTDEPGFAQGGKATPQSYCECIAGKFKGDVNVQGNLTIDAGAHVTGQVRAHTVTLGGELHGNIEGAARVELLDTGVLAGDVKAGSLTVAAGSRMRGQVEFGWSEQAARSIKGEAAAS